MTVLLNTRAPILKALNPSTSFATDIPARARQLRSKRFGEFYGCTSLRNPRLPKPEARASKFLLQANSHNPEELMNAKDEALAAIERARTEMEEAICQLE